MPATMIRPAAFMETYYIDQVELGILKGKLADPIRGDKTYQTIAADDIGAFVALAFERPTEFIGTGINVPGLYVLRKRRFSGSLVDARRPY